MNTPFTTEQFFSIFEKYNNGVFPAQLLIFLLAAFSLILVHTGKPWKDKFINFFLGFLWTWTGFIYHIGYFSEINKTAFGFGALFIAQGLLLWLFTWNKKSLKYSFSRNIIDYLAWFFILFGLVIYPLIAYLAHGSITNVIALGLPCPTTILTFGFFMLARKHFPKGLLIIPGLWALIGLMATFNFGVYQDLMMIISAITAFIAIFSRRPSEK